MAGGAQLIADLLQGAFGGNKITPDQAAKAAGYDYTHTPEAQLAGLNNSLDDDQPSYPDIASAVKAGLLSGKPIYANSQTGETTEDPLSKLPAKQPGFLQRAFAQGDAARANSINSQFVSNPAFAAQAHDTALGLKGKDFSLARDSMNQPIGNMNPMGGSLLVDGNPDASNMSDLAAGMARSNTGTRLAVNNATQAKAINDQMKSIADAANNNPVTSSKVDAARYQALLPTFGNDRTLQLSLAQNNYPQIEAGAMTSGAQASKGESDIANATQPSRLSGSVADAGVAAALAQGRLGQVDDLLKKQDSDIAYERLMSNFRSPPGPLALMRQPNGSYVLTRTGAPNKKMAEALAMANGSGKPFSGTDNGKQVTLPPMPMAQFNEDGNPVTPTIGSGLTTSSDQSDDDITHKQLDPATLRYMLKLQNVHPIDTIGRWLGYGTNSNSPY